MGIQDRRQALAAPERAQEGFRGLFQAGQPATQVLAGLGSLERALQPGEPGGRAGPAQHGAFQRAHPGAERTRRKATGRKRMLERGEQRERRKAAGGHLRAQAQEGPRRAVGERTARRIVDLEAPAPELRRHAPRQAPVGGDQRRAATRLVQRPAQDERDDARFLAWPRAVDARDAFQRMAQFAGFGAVIERRPRGGRRGGPERKVDQARARRRRLAELHVRPRHHVRARNTQAFQKHR